MRAVQDIPKGQKPYKRYGAAITAWRSSRRELLLAGPANTGKSRVCLEKLHYCADKYPGMRGLIVRKTRHSITQSAMVTYETKVLPDGCMDNTIRWNTTDQQYEYPNGSIIAVGGMDKPSKIMSSEWDMIYVQEATELNEEDWEALTIRLRNHVMPYQQLIADCNPSYPTHWLKLRADRGATLMLESRHEDNPSVTKEDLAALDALTGVYYLRYRKGIWAAAEGMVYDAWDRSIHRVSLAQLVEWNILTQDEKINREGTKQVIAGVDWGFTNPGVIQVYCVDGDERLYLIHELYMTQKVDDWWVEQAKKLKALYKIEHFVCDPAEPAYITKFNANGLSALAATNDISPGISAVQSRLKVQEDGRARFFVYEYSLKERDEARAQVKQPLCLENEIEAYVWPKAKDGQTVKEVPVKVNDHAMDAMRYVAMYFNGPTANVAVQALKERLQKYQQRDAVPQQGSFVLPQEQRPFWEV